MPAAKLAFYNHTGAVSGAEGVLLAIVAGLDRSRFAPVVLSPHGSLAEACALAGIAHTPVPLVEARFTGNPVRLASYLLGVGSAIRSIRRQLAQQRPALVHANSVRAGLVASLAAAGLGIPVLWHIHDILPRHPLTAIIRRIARIAPRTALLAVSNATARSFRGGNPGTAHDLVRKPIDVVYNSIDLDRFEPNPQARARVRTELGLEPHHVAVGVIGQLTPRKGQLALLNEFALARARMPNVVLLLVGAAMFHEANIAYGRSLETRIRELGLEAQVRLLGSRADIADVLNAVDLLAQNSSNEPLGLALMEGFATEKTCAATGVDGVLEVTEDGVTGLLSPAGDPAALVQNIERLAADPALRAAMGRRARQKMLAEFAPALQVARMHALYDRLLGLSPRVSTEAPAVPEAVSV